MENKTEQPKLTVKQAIEQGFTQFLYPADGYQALGDLSDIHDSCFNRGKIELVNKDPHSPDNLDAKSIIEMIAERIYCQHVDETGDDTDEVYQGLITVNSDTLKPFLDAIQEKLDRMNYYKSSGIELIKQ